jgi:hypothetical protein
MLSIIHYRITSFNHHFKCPLSPNKQQFPSIWSIRYVGFELALLNLDDHHHFMPSSHGLYEIFILMQTHEKIPNSHRNTKHINYELVCKVQFTIAYHTTRSHLIPRGTSFMLCVLINRNPIFALCFGQPCIFTSPLMTRCLENK